MLDKLKERGFEIQFQSHAAAILERATEALADIEKALLSFMSCIAEIISSGGGDQRHQRLRKALTDLGWPFTVYEIKKTINGSCEGESISHEIDHVKAFKGGWEGSKAIALEIEWNNKDPFFTVILRTRLFAVEGAISLGIVITRGTSLQKGMREIVTRYAKDKGINSFDDLVRLGTDLPRCNERTRPGASE